MLLAKLFFILPRSPQRVEDASAILCILASTLVFFVLCVSQGAALSPSSSPLLWHKDLLGTGYLTHCLPIRFYSAHKLALPYCGEPLYGLLGSGFEPLSCIGQKYAGKNLSYIFHFKQASTYLVSPRCHTGLILVSTQGTLSYSS